MPNQGRDPASFRTADLIDAYVENIRLFDDSEHVGHANRVAGRRARIVEALMARGEASALLPLLSHADLDIRLSAALDYKKFDRAAALAVVEQLAARQDPVGERARGVLRVGIVFGEPAAAAAPHQIPDRVFWRSRRPPPGGVTLSELKARVAAIFPESLAGAILALARPAIGIWPQSPAAGASPTGSRFGGMPVAPAGWTWPVCEEEPLLFIAQIDCRELAGYAAAAPLPRNGLLSFFADFDGAHGCGLWFDGQHAVHYWPATDALAPAAPPLEDFAPLPEAKIRFFETVDLPDPQCEAVARLGIDADQLASYRDLHKALRAAVAEDERYDDIYVSKLLGWPDQIQGEDVLPLEDRRDRWRLLAQFGGYENGIESQDWGPGGLLYFVTQRPKPRGAPPRAG